MRLHRRHVLGTGLAAAAALALSPAALTRPLPTLAGAGAARRSDLFPGLRLVHADLHNHSHLSDGAGDPERFHTSLRTAGLDVAALTDHTLVGMDRRDFCAAGSPVEGEHSPCRQMFGMTGAGFRRCRELADIADTPGRYAAVPGFEWSSPHLGHVNVWFGEDWVDPLSTGGLTADGLARSGGSLEQWETRLRMEFGHLLTDVEITALVEAVRGQQPAGMRPLYEWLLRRPGDGRLGGGADALAGFNHPNREPGVFDNFAFDHRVASRMVSLEMFNRDEDYLFKNLAGGAPSPLVACLNAGWQVGIIGTTDEHSPSWGSDEGKGRAGLWLRRLHRHGVREALLARRAFATRQAGIRVAATAEDVPMGGTIPLDRGPVRFALDLDLGPQLSGMPVSVQVLRPGRLVPEVVEVLETTSAPTRGGPVRFTVPLDRADGDWMLLRIADPATPSDSPAPFAHPCNNFALAYTSPWWLRREPSSTSTSTGMYGPQR